MNDKRTLILLAIAALLVVVIFVFTPQVTLKPRPPGEELFFPARLDEVTKVELVGSRNLLVLLKYGDTWYWKQEPRQVTQTGLTGEQAPPVAAEIKAVADKADAAKVKDLVGQILGLGAIDAPIRPRRGGVVEDLGGYGLAEVDRRIIVTYARTDSPDKKTRRILNLGAVTSTENAVYCKFEDAPEVMFASRDAGRLLADATEDPQAYRNHALFDLGRLEDLRGVLLNIPGKMDMQAKLSGELWRVGLDRRDAVTGEPVTDRASNEALQRIVDKFKAMRIEKFEADNVYNEIARGGGMSIVQASEEKLAPLGLTEKTAEYIVGFAKSEEKLLALLIGKATTYDPSLRLVRWITPPYGIGKREGADVFEVNPQFHVFAVKADFLKDLNAKLDDYRAKKLMPFETRKVVRIEITHDADAVIPQRTTTQPDTRPATLPARPYPDRPERIVLLREVDKDDRLTDNWSIDTPVKTAADTSVVEELLRALRATSAMGFADGQTDRDLGLSPAAIRLSVYEKDARLPKATLLIGRSVGTRFFARMGGVTPDNIARQFDATDRDEIDLALLKLYQRKMIPTSLAKAVSLTLERTGKPKLIAERLASGRWFLAEPEKIHGGYNLQSLVDAVGNLKAKEAVADSSDDLATYGLKAPALTVTVVEPREKKLIVTTQPETVKPSTQPDMLTYTVRIGKKVGDSDDVYAMVEGRDVVYRIGSAISDAADNELRGRRVLADLTDLEKKRVQTLRLTQNNVTLQLDQFEGTWKAVSPKGFEADKAEADKAAYALMNLDGDGFTVATDKAALGLDSPALQLEVKYAPSDEAEALWVMAAVGKEFTVTKDDTETKFRYVLTRNETVARHVKSEDLEDLLRDAAAYMPKEIVKLEETQKAKTITLKRPGLTFTAVAEGEYNWKLTDPVETDASWNVNSMARDLTALTAERVVVDEPTEAQLAEYGLDDPAYLATLTIETEKPDGVASAPAPETLVVKIGAPVDAAKADGPRYAMASTRNVVYVVKGDLVETLGKSIRKDDIFGSWPSPEQVAVTQGGKKFALIKTSADGADSYAIEIDGKITNAKKDDCKKFFDALRDMKADTFVVQADDEARLAEFGLAEPALHVEMKEKDKDAVVVEIGKLTPETAGKTVPDQRYYARRLGRPGVFLMKAEDVLKFQKPAADYKPEPPATQPATVPANGG